MENKRFFNLLKPVEAPKGEWDKVYDWIITRARIVILIVEILIVIAFFAKVVVDNEKKNKEQNYYDLREETIALEQNYEDQFIEIQKKDLEYKKLWRGASNYAVILGEIYSFLPDYDGDITIRISDENVDIIGYGDITPIESLENSLKNSASFIKADADSASDRRDFEESKTKYAFSIEVIEEKMERETDL